MKSLVAAVLILAVCWLAWLGGPYALAMYEFDKLSERRPKTRSEVEETLFLYKSMTIDIADSPWGSGIKLQPGEYCQQYLILGREPIDVVYDEENNVIHLISSYE